MMNPMKASPRHPALPLLPCCLGLFLLLLSPALHASKLVRVTALDREHVMIHCKDGEVIRRDDGFGNCAFQGNCHHPDGSHAVWFGEPLDTAAASLPSSWVIVMEDGKRIEPYAVFRKTRLNGMTLSEWDASAGARGDWRYDITREHHLYLKLPTPIPEGQAISLEIAPETRLDTGSASFTFDSTTNRSEAIHVNLWGYGTGATIKAADLHHWMGDGGARDFSAFEGNQVWLVEVDSGVKHEVGKVSLWRAAAPEMTGYDFAGSPVWTVDFTGFDQPGTWRLAVEGVGCSEEFRIARDTWYEPFRVSTLGFFYMRLGQNSPEINPRPREPLFIPGVDDTVVYISELQPYHPDWKEISSRVGDAWDHPKEFERYHTGRTNDQAWGGHSDAYDWDKRLPHVSIIYDMLLPYLLTGGALSEDHTGIAESGNGIPDLLDTARFEVDAWLRMRDGEGYAHGISCPLKEGPRVRFQGGATAVAAWANALNCAMLAEAFGLSNHRELRDHYLNASLEAYHHADGLEDPQLDLYEGDGFGRIRGRDFKMMAAAFLYNLTGDPSFEDAMAKACAVRSGQSKINDPKSHNQLFGVVAYLTSDRPVHYPELREAMKQAILREATEEEAGHVHSRPSRRGTCQDSGYFWTAQNMQRTIIAHAIAEEGDLKASMLNALILEADWGLGRNPANIIQMTTASTPMQGKRSVEAAYTSGYNDGMPGLHPGHTPYWNMNNWAPGMIMGRPGWMAEQGYPEQAAWPVAELFFPTDYVWSHTEFTPQQTLRGKQALYGYLHALSQSNP
jgi:endoglucanase